MDDAFEAVAAENKLLGKEVKMLRERMEALESSRWWRLHPRHAARRLAARRDRNEDGDDEHAVRWDVRRVAEQRRLKVEFGHTLSSPTTSRSTSKATSSESFRACARRFAETCR
jgi:hypothetical protein